MDVQTYILLMNLTEQGSKTIKQAPNRVQAAEKAFAAMGGKLLGMYAVMGEYDYVAIGEIPNDEAAMSFLLSLASMGNVKTKTLRAFPQKEFAKIVKKLP